MNALFYETKQRFLVALALIVAILHDETLQKQTSHVTYMCQTHAFMCTMHESCLTCKCVVWHTYASLLPANTLHELRLFMNAHNEWVI